MPITITIANDATSAGPLKPMLDAVGMAFSTSGMEVAPGASETVVSDFPLRGVIIAADPTDNWSVEVTHDMTTADLRLIARSGNNLMWDVNGSKEETPTLASGDIGKCVYTGTGELHMIAVPKQQQASGQAVI